MTWVALSLAAVAVALGAFVFRLRRERALLDARVSRALRQLEHVETAFGRFAPEAVVDRIVAEGVGATAERREVTVLFADLHGFTSMSGDMAPEDLLEVLSGYFQEMGRAITENRGHVSKFLGDGILAHFGALRHNPWQARDAVEAALAMRAALARYNERLAAAGREPLSMGVGIHKGEAVAGIVGSAQLMEHTVIGDVVNVASRIEGLTRDHGVDVLITEDVYAALGDHYLCREFAPVSVKGKRDPVATWTVDDRARPSL